MSAMSAKSLAIALSVMGSMEEMGIDLAATRGADMTEEAKHKILCYLRDTRPLGGIIFAAEGDPGAMAVVETEGRLTAAPPYERVGVAAKKANFELREALERAASAMEAEAVVLRAAGYARSCADALERKAAIARAALSKPERDGK